LTRVKVKGLNPRRGKEVDVRAKAFNRKVREGAQRALRRAINIESAERHRAVWDRVEAQM
jgi:hypothetical protein